MWSNVLTGQVQCVMTLSADSVMIGDEVELQIFVKSRSNQKDYILDFSTIDTLDNLAFQDPPLPNFSIDMEWLDHHWDADKNLPISLSDTKDASGFYTWESAFTVIFWDLGVFDVALPDVYDSRKNPINAIKGRPPRILANAPIDNAPLDTTQMIHDIAPIMLEERNWQDHLYWILPLAFLILVSFAVFYGMKRRLKPSEYQEPIITKPPVPAHIKALHKLKALRQSEKWKEGDGKDFQTELSFIVREYLENRYNVQALESTTPEILSELKKMSFDQDYVPPLKNLLQIADLVKFAKAEPPSEMNEGFLDTAEDFVMKTKKVELETEDDAE